MCIGNLSWGLPAKKVLAGERIALGPNSRIKVMFCVAGFRPGRRGPFDLAQDRPFVSAKGPKTMCAEHVQQLEGVSPFDNLMEVKS